MFLFCFFALFLSCNDYTLEKNNVPELVVYPETVDFGHLLSGQESGVKTFAIINAGTDPLTITQPVLSDNMKFSLDTLESDSYEIQDGEIIEFHVYYNPTTYEQETAAITFSSNDSDESDYELPVVGFGDAPLMTVSPEIFDYGQISIGCDNEERITIRNDGNISLIIENISQMVTHPQDIIMEFGSLPSFPWELSPNQEIDFLVSYVPLDVSYDESVIRIESNDPVLPIAEVIQYGEGDVEHWYTQTHIQEEVPLTDIIFVIDNSGSMNTFQTELANQMSSFMNVFISLNSDYHIAFITTDEANFVSYNGVSWIDSRYTNPTQWAEEVVRSIGINGSAFEMGIEYVSLALQGDAAPGTSFWRDSATLAIIYVSDEPDNSPMNWAQYTSFFDSLKVTPDLMKHFAVIGDYPSGCLYRHPAGSRNVSFGAGYYEMTQYYSGEWYSICSSDWGQQMQNLANTVTTQQVFILEEHDPIEGTITVNVNGQQTNNWIYDLSLNAIVFDSTSIPTQGQTITIEYATWGCDN